MKTIQRIPKFKSEEEEAKFWDTHDVADFCMILRKSVISNLQNPASVWFPFV